MARRRHTVMWLVGPQTLMTRDPNWERHESMDMRLSDVLHVQSAVYWCVKYHNLSQLEHQENTSILEIGRSSKKWAKRVY
jgi:hypothetical protein